MFLHARGEMFDWLQRNEACYVRLRPGLSRAALERNGYLADNLLAVHVNYLAPGDAALLGRRGVSVAHCRAVTRSSTTGASRETDGRRGPDLCLGN